MRRRSELAAHLAPTPRLDARHGNREAGLRRHEDRQVDDAILLGADQLLAVDDEHVARAVVDDLQFGHAAASDTSVTRAVRAATASVSVSYHGSGAGWRRSGMTVRPATDCDEPRESDDRNAARCCIWPSRLSAVLARSGVEGVYSI